MGKDSLAVKFLFMIISRDLLPEDFDWKTKKQKELKKIMDDPERSAMTLKSSLIYFIVIRNLLTNVLYYYYYLYLDVSKPNKSGIISKASVISC